MAGKPQGKRPPTERDRKQYEQMLQYGSRGEPPSYGGRGNGGKQPHPQQQYPHAGYQNQSDAASRAHSHSMKQSGPGSRMNQVMGVVVDSKIILPSKQYPTPLGDQLNPEDPQQGGNPPLPPPAEHVLVGGGVGGDPGVRETPSGASSPNSGTPNNTLGKQSKVLYPYDPLTSSSSETKLIMGGGGHPGGPQNRNLPQPPHDGMDTQSDTNLLNYYSKMGGAGGVARSHPLGGQQVKGAQHKTPPHKNIQGVKGSIRNWESRGQKFEGVAGEGGPLAGRVLHPPVSTGTKDRGQEVGVAGGSGGVAPMNGYPGESRGEQSSLFQCRMPPKCVLYSEVPLHIIIYFSGTRTKLSMSPEQVGVAGPRPSSSDSGYVPSSTQSSAHSLSPSHPNHTPSAGECNSHVMVM